MATAVFYRLQVFITVTYVFTTSSYTVPHKCDAPLASLPMSMNELLVVGFHKHAIVTHQRIHC